MNRPIHFEIHAEDLERASTFYSKLFGWKFTKREWGDAEYMMVVTGEDEPGINGGMVKRRGENPTPESPVKWNVFTIEVENVDKCIEQAVELGAVVALPKQAIPGLWRLAYLIDTEKNIFGVMHTDPSAA